MEDGHISFGYTDFNYGPFGGVFGNFSKDSSVVKDTHYYREIRVTYDERSFGDCFDHVHPVGYYDLPCDFGYDDYYQFLYNTETGYVESIKLFYTFTTNEEWDSEPFKEGRDSLKETLLSDADKYNIIDVDFIPSDYQVVVSFGIDKVGKFDTEISHLLSERQDINKFVKDVSRDLDQHPDLKPEDGSNYIYVLTSAECDGVRVEWYD